MSPAKSLVPSRQLLKRILVVLALVVTVTLLVASVAFASKPNPDHKVTICHRTTAYTNPYRVITVDVASIFKQGHDTHNGPIFYRAIPKHQKWGDIIPSFRYDGKFYPGKNWPAGQKVLDNGCKTPGVPPTTTTIPVTTIPVTTIPVTTIPCQDDCPTTTTSTTVPVCVEACVTTTTGIVTTTTTTTVPACVADCQVPPCETFCDTPPPAERIPGDPNYAG